jgi:hypothetical protein
MASFHHRKFIDFKKRREHKSRQRYFEQTRLSREFEEGRHGDKRRPWKKRQGLIFASTLSSEIIN